MEEQINDTSNEVVETQVDAVETFAKALESQESNQDEPEVNDEQEDEEAVEETVEEAESKEVDEESDEDELDDTDEDDVEVEERKTYRVKAGGEEKDVTLEELVSGYQKGDDYTKKSQTLAEARKKVEAHAHEVQQAMQVKEEYAQRLAQVEQFLMSDGEQVNLEELKENDPIQYAIKVAEQTETNKKINLLRQERAKVQQQQQAYQAQQQHAVVANEAKMLSEKVKEFSDPKKAEQIKNDIRSFGKSVGFSDQELSQVYDHRHVLILQKAMEYDKLQQSKAGVNKKLSNAPRMAKKGKKVVNADTYTKQKKRLKSSGKLTDAVDVFKNFI
jgi:hypothetical protein